MGSLSALLLLSASCLALISTAGLLLVTLSGRRRGIGVLQGLRTSLRRPIEGLVRAIPTALVVSVVLASLSVGDSLELMVRENTDRNLSGCDASITSNGPMDDGLMERLSSISGSDINAWAPIIQRDAQGRSEGTGERTDIRLLALDDRALDLSPLRSTDGEKLDRMPEWTECYVNEELSRSSGAKEGDWILLELANNALSARSLLGMSKDATVRINLTVREVLKDVGWGHFREDARSEAPAVLIANLSMVSFRLGWNGRSDRFLLDLGLGGSVERVKGVLDGAVDLDAAGMSIGRAESAGGSMLWSDDVFFQMPEGLGTVGEHIPTLSYFVDSIEGRSGSVPYSVVTGMENDLGRGGIAVGEWLRDRLNITLGDTLELRYRRLTELGTLVEGNRSFVVRDIVPRGGLAAEPSLMPPIPGITEAASCSDWDPSFDIDLDLIGEEDRAYWDELRTSPKAFISLEDAREMWQVHYGNTTAVWFPDPPEDLAEDLDGLVGAKEAGMMVLDLRERALSSSRGLEIFPPMFLTFGIPFMAASIFVLFSLERDLFIGRLEELSILRAVGAPKRVMAASFVWSGIPSLLLGALLGVISGALLGSFFSAGLSSIWSTTVENARVPFSFSVTTVLTSVLAGFSLSLLASLVLSLLHSGKVPVKNLRGEDASMTGRWKKLSWGALSLLTMVFGLALLMLLWAGPGQLPVEALFIISTAALSAGFASLILLAVPVVRSSGQSLLLSSELSRRPARYPLAGAVIALTLSLVLSMTAVSGTLLDSDRALSSSYGGGYELIIELSVPFSGDVQAATAGVHPGIRAVPLFTVGSEGGTCTNINAIYPPRLIGVGNRTADWKGFKLLERDGSFGSDEKAWSGLSEDIDGKVPILVDQNTLVWIYGKGLGDVFTIGMENGDEVELTVIGILSPSVLTGTFVMSREHLLAMFPSIAGVRMVLVDVQGTVDAKFEAEMERALPGGSLRIRSTRELARENLEGELSYLDLFRDLLLLGLFTATVSSFAFVHSRVVSLSRELSVLRAVGFDRRRTFIHLTSVNLAVISASVISAVVCSLISFPVLSHAVSADAGAGGMPGLISMTLAFAVFTAIISMLSAWLAVKGFTGLVVRD
ncbi:MAG: ABC transporter permease [Candidatus Thermoplasmatota archaeon]|nr:ABC transporter permease [Candidatus Thermoplasmatota archaeon]